MPKLVLSTGEEVREFVLNDGDTLGRAPQSAITLDGNGVSRTHCKFIRDGAAWAVEDLGSSNGTLVNGRKVSRFELADGDEISVGSLKLRFLVGGTEAPAIEESGGWGEDDLSLEEKHFLVLGFEGRRGDVLPLPEGRVTVGRNARHALIIRRASVSGDHAELVREGSRVLVRDLSSSNGTFVNDQRVVEQELSPGAAVRFGDSLVIYGKGDAKDFVLPAVTESDEALASDSDSTDNWNADAAFELKSQAPAGERLWSIIAVLAVLGVAAAGAWYFIFTEHKGNSTEGTFVRRGANLLSESAWSFEAGMDQDPPLWERVDSLDTADIEVSSSGKTHQLSIARTAATGASLVGCRELLPVTGGTAWHLSARIAGEGKAVLGARFSSDGKGERRSFESVFAQELLSTDATAGEIAGEIVVPEGSASAEIVVGLVGSGEVLFDDVQVTTAAEAAQPHKVDDFAARKSALGGVRLTRLGARIVDGMALVPASSTLLGWSPHQPSLESNALGYTAVFSAPAGTEAVEFRVLVPQGESAIVLQDGAKGRRVAEAVDACFATAVVLGQGGNRARLSFANAAGTSERLSCSWRPSANGAGLLVAKVQQPALRVDVQVRFETERQEATQLRNAAREAARAGASGRAVERALSILERFPFDEDMVRECTQLVAEHSELGRKAVESLSSEVDDLLFFRNWKEASALEARLAAEINKHTGHTAGETLQALASQVREAAVSANAAGSSVAGERLLARARDYVELGRDTLARAFLKAVVERFAATDSADEATQLLKQLDGKGGR